MLYLFLKPWVQWTDPAFITFVRYSTAKSLLYLIIWSIWFLVEVSISLYFAFKLSKLLSDNSTCILLIYFSKFGRFSFLKLSNDFSTKSKYSLFSFFTNCDIFSLSFSKPSSILSIFSFVKIELPKTFSLRGNFSLLDISI